MSGTTIAILGAGICAALAGCGSAIGVMLAGKASAGITSEKPELFGKMLLLQALPATQGLYGFLIAVIVMVKLQMFTGGIAIDEAQGMQIFYACLPMAIVGLLSGICQGKTAVAAIHMTGKQPDASGKGVTMTILVETYAILALLVSFLFIQFGVIL